jgi:mannose-6-phosphate isomerase-like protein (cupin superfamily)
MKISKNQAVHHGREGVDGYYYQLPHVQGGTTVAYAEFTSEHGQRTIGEKERMYFILDGKAEFEVNGEKFNAEKDDLVVIPPHGTYNLWPQNGTLKILLYMEYLDFDK